jgi:hypothetical protein
MVSFDPERLIYELDGKSAPAIQERFRLVERLNHSALVEKLKLTVTRTVELVAPAGPAAVIV